MLLNYGCGRQRSNWIVQATRPPRYTRVYYILGGNTTYRADGVSRVLEHGCLYLFPAHIPYEITTDPTDPICCMHMHLDMRSVNHTALVSIDPKEDPSFENLISALTEGIRENYPAGYIEDLANAFEKLCAFRGLVSAVDDRTNEFLEVLEKSYRTDLPLSDIAASFGYSPEHFIRIFKERVGIPPHQYIIRRRMTEAIRMLSAGVSLDHIADAIGYADGRCFSNAFRNYYGISPSVYRKYYAGQA